MELVYLWVDKYKNISNQGFNLSSKFRCSYNTDTNELTINETGNKVADIFPKNISVLALIGENGSGKSALAEMILLSLCATPTKDRDKNANLFVVYLDNDKLKISYFGNINNDVNNPIVLKDENGKTYKFQVIGNLSKQSIFGIHYNPSIETFSSFFKKHFDQTEFVYILDYKPKYINNIFSFPSKRSGLMNIRKIHNTTILNMFKAKDEFGKEIEKIILETFGNDISFIPEKISFTPHIDDIFEFSNQTLDEALKDIKDDLDGLSVDSFYKCILILSIHFRRPDSDRKFETDFFDKDTNENFFNTIYN